MPNWLAKILAGVLFGIGFSIVAGAVFYYLTIGLMSDLYDNDVSDIALLEHREHRRGEDVVILGKLTNDGPSAARSLTIHVDLYDESGVYVDKCMAYVTGAVEPQATRTFKVSCGYDKAPPVEHASYKIYVVGL